MRRCIYKKIHYLTFDLVKVTRNVTQYPLHNVIYASTKFEVATSNGLGDGTITRNVMDGRTDARTDRRATDRLWYEINIPYFSNEKAGITRTHSMTRHHKSPRSRRNLMVIDPLTPSWYTPHSFLFDMPHVPIGQRPIALLDSSKSNNIKSISTAVTIYLMSTALRNCKINCLYSVLPGKLEVIMLIALINWYKSYVLFHCHNTV